MALACATQQQRIIDPSSGYAVLRRIAEDPFELLRFEVDERKVLHYLVDMQ